MALVGQYYPPYTVPTRFQNDGRVCGELQPNSRAYARNILLDMNHALFPSCHQQWLIIVQRTGTPAPRPPQARNLACASLLCPVHDVEHPSSNVTERNHVYVAVFQCDIDVVTNLFHVDRMCQA